MKKYKVMVEIIEIGYVIVEAEDEAEAYEEAIYSDLDDFISDNSEVNFGGDIRWLMDGPEVREIEIVDGIIKEIKNENKQKL